MADLHIKIQPCSITQSGSIPDERSYTRKEERKKERKKDRQTERQKERILESPNQHVSGILYST